MCTHEDLWLGGHLLVVKKERDPGFHEPKYY